MDTTPLNLETLTASPLPPREAMLADADWLRGTGRGTAWDPAGPLGLPGALAKRAIDLTAALTVLVMLFPLLAAIALAIRFDSAGPILFRQRRLGRHGRPFWILKFRTMRPDAERRLAELESRNEAMRGMLFKMTDDPRVTRLGRFLRRTNLDELPQFWNLLRGEMSLVGPRPFQLRDCERLRSHDPDAFARRLEMLPGLTGAWQVGRRDPTDSEHLLEMDLAYVENWSLATDLAIIYRTFGLLVRGLLNRW